MNGFALAINWRRHRGQHGVAAVEFALVSSVFFMLLIGAIEMGRILFYWNTITEATRLGSRVAVVCDLGDDKIRAKMTALFPVLATTDINLAYSPGSCTVESCESVTVTVVAKSIPTFIPFAALSLVLPPFTTTLSRESMQSNFKDPLSPPLNPTTTANPVCQ